MQGSDGVTMDEVAEYWDRRPCNVRHSDAAPGSAQWSEEVTAQKYFVEPHIPAFAQFQRWSGKTILEIGCGIGTDTMEFAKAGATVYALDVSGKSLGLARQRLPDQGLFGFGFNDQIHFFCMDAEEWVPPVAYDLVYSFGVLHHTPYPEAALRNARKWLKEDGELRIMLYNRHCIKWLLGEQPEAQAGCPLARRFTPWEARLLVEGCGFKVESIRKAHVFPYQTERYVHHEYVKRWFYRWMPNPFFAWLERNFGEHLLIVARKA